MSETAWHARSVDEVLRALRTSLQGLSAAGLAERRTTGKRNVVPEVAQVSDLRLLREQFQSPLIIILAAAAVVAFSVGELRDGWIILSIVGFNGLVGYLQERRAGEAMARLRSLIRQLLPVIREGQEREVSAEDLVEGDVVILETGVIVPADGRIVEAKNLKVDEAIFTGESIAASKDVAVYPDATPMPERRNLGWRGTTVVAGRGRMVVTEIGTDTRLGRIVGEVAAMAEPPTPFQREMGDFAKRLAFVVIVLSAGVFLLGLARSFPLTQTLLLAISLVVSLIPEGLPVVITLTFAWGMGRMARRRALIRKLDAVETLGAVTVIAADKTGTLTFGEMMVEEIVMPHRSLRVTGQGYRPGGDFLEAGSATAPLEDPIARRLIEVGVLNNDSRRARSLDGQERWIGDPTEISLQVLGAKAGLNHDDLDRAYPRVGEFSFDFARKYMVTFHEPAGAASLTTIKGAPRQLLALCTHQLTPDGVRPFTEADRQQARAHFDRMAEQSLRGLCLAYTEAERDWRTTTHENLSHGLTYLGLVGIRDTVRGEARATVETARAAGMRIVMLTGDYRVTAVAVARETGILTGDPSQRVADGGTLDALEPAAFRELVRRTEVYSRVSPEQKLRITRELRASGQVIAVTGDGINDVPALTEADIGVAIGLASADAAKAAAEMVVTDGNLTSLVAAIEEGRVIFRNIQRVLIYLLASNLGELLLILAALAGGLPLPLLPVHIIWLNVITDPFLGIGLAREPAHVNVMRERPRPPRTAILHHGHWYRILLNGAAIAVSGLAAFMLARAAGRDLATTYGLTLTTVAIGEWLVAFTIRSARRSALVGLHRNPLLNLALVVAVGLQVAIISIPTLARVFHLAPLRAGDWLLAVLLGGFVLVVEEIRKLILRRRSPPRRDP